MAFQKGHAPYPKRDTPAIIATPTPPPPEVAAAEAAQAARESDPINRVKPGQDAFDQAMEDQHRHDRADNLAYGMPEPVADYEGTMARLPFDPKTVGLMFGESWDISTVTPQMMKDYGINPETHVPVWDYMDNYGNRGIDYEREHLNNNPWDRVATYVGPDQSKRGRKFTRDGMVMFARPREVAGFIEQRFQDVSVDLRENAPNENPPLPHDDSPEMRKLRAETQRSIEKYLADSPSRLMGGNNLDTALSRFSPEETARLQDQALQAANPAGYARLQNLLSAENQRDRTAESLKAAAAGRGKSVSVSIAFDQEGRIIR